MITCLSCHGTDTEKWADAVDKEYRTVPDTFSFWKCKTCGALSIDPVPEDKLGEIYPSNYYSYTPGKESFAQKIKSMLDRRMFKKLLDALKRPELAVLDIGGGNGWLLDVVKETDARVSHTQVVDIDSGAKAIAEKKGHNFFQGTVEQFETDQKYDLVLLLNLIEHVKDPTAVLEKVASILHPEGVVLVKTPNTDAWDARLFRHQSWGGFHTPRHWVLFDKESMTECVKDTGLEFAEFSYTQGAPFWACSAVFWLESKGMAKVTAERPVHTHPLYPVFQLLFAGVDFIRMPFAKTSQMVFTLKRKPEA